MKKVTKIVTLTAALMLGLAAVPAGIAVAKQVIDVQTGVEAKVGDYHDIHVYCSDAVTVDVPLSAQAGSLVNYSVSAEKGVTVYGVFANMEYAGYTQKTGEGYFVMPDMDVEFFVESDDFSAGTEQSAYLALNLMQSYGVLLSGFEGYEAEAIGEPGYWYLPEGNLMTFNVGFEPGCDQTFCDYIEIYTLDLEHATAESTIGDMIDGQVDTWVDETGAYNFFMPSKPIVIFPLTENKGYLLTIDSLACVKSVQTGAIDSEGTVGTLSAAAGKNPYFIPSGNYVYLTLQDTKKYTVKGIEVNGQQVLLKEGEYTLGFVMPAQNVELNVIADAVLYDILVDTNTYTGHYDWLAVYTSTTSGGTYKKEDGFKAGYGDYVRVYYKLKDGAAAAKPNVVYALYGDTWASRASTSKGYDEIGDYVQFYHSGYVYKISVNSEYKALTINNPKISDDMTAKFVRQAGDEWVEYTGYYFQGDYVYVQFTPKAGVDAKVSNPVLKYSTNSTNKLVVADEANQVYKSNSYLYNYTYTLNYSVAVLKYADYCFVGTYEGANIYNNGANSAYVSDTYSPKIDAYGSVVQGSSYNYTLEPDGTNTVKTGQGSALVNGKRVHYSDQWWVSSYNYSKDVFSTNDCVYGFKAPATCDWFYFSYNFLKDSFTAISAYDADDNLLGSMFWDASGDHIYLEGVEFEYLDSTTYPEEQGKFNVKVNGVVVGQMNGTTYTPAN